MQLFIPVTCNGAAEIGLQSGHVLGEHISHSTVDNGAATCPLLSLDLLSHALRKQAPESGNANDIAYITMQYVD